MATTPTIQRPGAYTPQHNTEDTLTSPDLWTDQPGQKGIQEISPDDDFWDVNVSRANLYAGTVLEHRPFLAQQMLTMLRPHINNPALLMTDVFMTYIFMADVSFRRRARKKRACGVASKIIGEEEALRELLQSYRSALYSG